MSANNPSQADRIYDLLLDGNPHSVIEIIKEVYGLDHCGYPNVHGRVTDIRKKYGVNIINFKDDKVKSLTYYQIVPSVSVASFNLDNGVPVGQIPLEEMPEYSAYNGGQDKLI